MDWATHPCDPGMVVAMPHLSLAGPQHLVYRWPVGVGPLQGELAGMPSCGCPRPQSHPGETDGPSLISGWPKDWADRWAGTRDPNPLGPSHTLAFNLPIPTIMRLMALSAGCPRAQCHLRSQGHKGHQGIQSRDNRLAFHDSCCSQRFRTRPVLPSAALTLERYREY